MYVIKRFSKDEDKKKLSKLEKVGLGTAAGAGATGLGTAIVADRALGKAAEKIAKKHGVKVDRIGPGYFAFEGQGPKATKASKVLERVGRGINKKALIVGGSSLAASTAGLIAADRGRKRRMKG